MVGSSTVPPFATAVLIYFPPEPPHWSLVHNRPKESLLTVLKLRSTSVTGTKDFYVLYESVKYERTLDTHLSTWKHFTLPLQKKKKEIVLLLFSHLLGS